MTAHAHPTEQVNSKQGRILVQLARETIMKKLGQPISADEQRGLAAALDDPIFHEKGATFVTLTRHGQLRGCIGSLSAVQPLGQNVRRNAENAAFHDPRFAPLTPAEAEQVEIEVSVLTAPRPLTYTDADDLMATLRPGEDGVIIRKGAAGATFLPQVWDQLPDPVDFLTHLCLKAGLSGQAWRDTRLDVSIYQVQYFKEGG